MELPPIATTTVGSFPRPGWLINDPVRGEVTFRPDQSALLEAHDDATTVVLREQEEAGLDLLTDGEQRRTQFIYHILASWDGIDLENRHPKFIRRKTVRESMVGRVVDRIQRRSQAVVEDMLFAKAHTSLPIKMSVPGPVTVVDSTYDEVYGDEKALAMDVAVALNAELLELQAAGCGVLQIDEPAMTRYHEKVAEYGASALDRCLEGITIPTLVHLCYGYPLTGASQYEFEYPELLSLLLETRIGGFSVEFGRSNFDPAILRPCRDRLVMFGCIDPGDSRPQPLATVVDRIRAALSYIDPARTLIAPDCGLMTVSRESARNKTRLLVDAARQLRSEL